MDFRPLDPFHLSEKAIKFLSEAIKTLNLDFWTIDEYVLSAQNLNITIMGVFDGDLIGCFTIETKQQKDRKILVLSLLGGANLSLWAQHLSDFLFLVAANNQCTDFSVIGRPGLARIFPQLTLDACIYSRKLTT